MNVLTISGLGTDLASRKAAAALRRGLETAFLAGSRVVIDFASVISLSHSYADELFGVLVARHGLDRFSDQVVIRNASAAVFRVIAQAISTRLEAQNPNEPDIALLSARNVLEARKRAA